jgi:hypothetical protein
MPGWRWLATAAAAACAGLLWLSQRPSVAIELAPAAVGSLERIAIATHARVVGGEQPLALRTTSAGELRAWLGARGFSAALVSERPAEDGSRFQPVGVAPLGDAALPAAAVVYHVDGQPVVLVTARQADVPDAPEWTWHGKRVRYRRVGEGGVLSWSNSGKAYALVSGLPHLGREACLLCHGDDARRRVIRSLEAPGT